MKVRKLPSVLSCVSLSVISFAVSAEEVKGLQVIKSQQESQQNTWVDDFKGDYVHMELEKVRQQLDRKLRVHKFLKEQAKIKQQRDEEKRRLIYEIKELDEANKGLVLDLEKPFKQDE